MSSWTSARRKTTTSSVNIDANTKRAGEQHSSSSESQHFHHHAGELHFKIDAAHDRTIVQGDVNGDGKADLQILLAGQHVLHATDFIL